MLALESTCVVKTFRVQRMYTPDSFIFYFFVAYTFWHLCYVISPLIVATLTHIEVVTVHTLSIAVDIAAMTPCIEAITALAASTTDYV